jgi:hypothetical protein
MERKFFIPEAKIPWAASLLQHSCPPDRQYPQGVIHSLYYDTEDLEDYEDSQQGSRHRKKIRIRWYEPLPEDGSRAAVFLEMKIKNGFAGQKKRQVFHIPVEVLRAGGWKEGILPYPVLLNTLAQFGFFPEKRLIPVIRISYRRRRYTDLMTGARVSLDWRIESVPANWSWTSCRQPLRMEGAVVEVKGRSAELHKPLALLKHLETDWTRYSKYACCLQAHLEEPGSFGRRMPSGRTSREDLAE